MIRTRRNSTAPSPGRALAAVAGAVMVATLILVGGPHGRDIPAAEAAASFSITPASPVNITTSQTGVNVKINATGIPAANIGGVHLKLTYDPSIITVTNFVCGVDVQFQLSCPKTLTSGSATLDMALDTGSGTSLFASTGPVEVGSLTFSAAGSAGSTDLSIAELEFIADDFSTCLEGFAGQNCTSPAPNPLTSIGTVTATGAAVPTATSTATVTPTATNTPCSGACATVTPIIGDEFVTATPTPTITSAAGAPTTAPPPPGTAVPGAPPPPAGGGAGAGVVSPPNTGTGPGANGSSTSAGLLFGLLGLAVASLGAWCVLQARGRSRRDA